MPTLERVYPDGTPRLADSDEAIEAALIVREVKLGRGTKYQPDIAAEILDRISCGESMSKILRDEHMPAQATVHRWRRLYPSFQKALAQARILQGESAANMVLEASAELIESEDVSPQRAKAIAFAQRGLQWIAERHTPDTYAPQQRVNVTHHHDIADRLRHAKEVQAQRVNDDEPVSLPAAENVNADELSAVNVGGVVLPAEPPAG